jgi:hypothetical protein
VIVWLASYPRSGSTLLRTVIRRVFGSVTYSVYDDPNDIGADPAIAEAVGHVNHGRAMAEFIAEARASSQRYLVKTHEPPPDDSPAIYVVRDGRAAIVSLFHYWQEILRRPMTLERAVLGDLYSGAWADHLASWRPLQRPNTTLVRYELLARGDRESIATIGNVLGLVSTGANAPRFEDLNRLDARFFRAGSDRKNIDELDARCPELFWLRHGAAMVDVGYAGDDPFAALPVDRRQRLIDEVTRQIQE